MSTAAVRDSAQLVIDRIAAAAVGGNDLAIDCPRFIRTQKYGQVGDLFGVHHPADGVGARAAFGVVLRFNLRCAQTRPSGTRLQHVSRAFGTGDARVNAICCDAASTQLHRQGTGKVYQ